ncbi:MAG: heterocyst-inhibiting protein PatX [Cuspidothrix sp.]
MRAAISLLVSSLVFGSLAFNCEAVQTRFSLLLMAQSDSQSSPLVHQSFNIADNSKPSPNQPQKPNPHRGSGRRGLDGYLGNVGSVI